MDTPPIRVLFLCTHNAACSILAEALLNHMGQQRFQAYSAGSHPLPSRSPHPLGLQVLQAAGIGTERLFSKDWDDFGHARSPKMDLVITVCDRAAQEACPFWPGQPATAHWAYPDLAVLPGSEARQLAAFRHTLHAMRHRLELLVNLPDDRLDRLLLQSSVRRLAAYAF